MQLFICLLVTFLMSGCSGGKDFKQMTFSGTITEIDAVGDVIKVKVGGEEMAFSISDQAKIVRNAHDAGLLDIKEGHPVTIQYDGSSLGRNNIIRLVNNKESL